MALFTFLNAWWISLLLVLPFFREYGEKETDQAVPFVVYWKKALLMTTMVAASFTVIIAVLIKEVRL